MAQVGHVLCSHHVPLVLHEACHMARGPKRLNLCTSQPTQLPHNRTGMPPWIWMHRSIMMASFSTSDTRGPCSQSRGTMLHCLRAYCMACTFVELRPVSSSSPEASSSAQNPWYWSTRVRLEIGSGTKSLHRVCTACKGVPKSGDHNVLLRRCNEATDATLCSSTHAVLFNTKLMPHSPLPRKGSVIPPHPCYYYHLPCYLLILRSFQYKGFSA